MKLFAAAIVALVVGAGPAFATPIVFDASGTFQSGAVLGGTITIDTALGTVVSASLTAGPPWNLIFNNIESASYIDYWGYYDIPVDPGFRAIGGANVFFIELPVTTLVDYAGGALYSDANSTSLTGHGGSFSSIGTDALSVGALTAEAVPEPATLALFLVGLLGFGVTRFRLRGARPAA